MSNDGKVIGFMSPAELTALMNETGQFTVEGTGSIDGQPVIQATLKVMNSRTGEMLPGGLPFAVVLFKGPGEPGYSNVAIGTSVPVAELGLTLPADFFNRCNASYRFIRAYAMDPKTFVLQMDLFLRHATREYVKFCFGLWAAAFSQVLFALFGREEGDSFSSALFAFAASPEAAQASFAAAVEPPAVGPAEAAPELPSAGPEAPAETAQAPAEPMAQAVPGPELPSGEALPEQPFELSLEPAGEEREEPAA